MEIDHFLYHYRQFHKEFFPNITPGQKLNKLCEEIEEHINAVNEGDKPDIISETIDVMNTSIAYLVSMGVNDPLDAGWRKLQFTANKYRAERAANV